MTVAAVVAPSDQVLSLVADPRSYLCDDETARFDSYRHAQAAQDFLAGRVLVRALLNKVTQRPISTLRFQIASSRKPALLGADGWHFNLSHSHGLIAAAVADRPVGIDIETARRADWRLVARRLFSPAEVDHLTALPDMEGHAAFCQSWAYKEALIKAVGRELESLPEFPQSRGSDAPPWRPAAAPYDLYFTFALTVPKGAGHIAAAGPAPECAPTLLFAEAVLNG